MVKNEMVRACSTYGRGVYRVMVEKNGGKRPLGRPRPKWENKIMIDLQVVGWRVMDWIDLAQDRDMWQALVSAVMNFLVPLNEVNFLTS